MILASAPWVAGHCSAAGSPALRQCQAFSAGYQHTEASSMDFSLANIC